MSCTMSAKSNTGPPGSWDAGSVGAMKNIGKVSRTVMVTTPRMNQPEYRVRYSAMRSASVLRNGLFAI